MDDEGASKTPKSFVVKVGRVGQSVRSLVDDLRNVMEPNTATRLQTKDSNTLQDYLSVAGTLGVTHFVMLSQTDRTLSLRITRAPRGPTLQFKVQSFTLAADVRAMQVKPFLGGKSAFMDPPLVVLNNLAGADRHLQLVTTSLQNLFPAINVQTVKLTHCSRVVLFHRDPATEVISVRHYRISVNPLGLSKSVKRVAQNKVGSLSHLQDVSDYVLSAVKASESDVEDDDDVKVELTQTVRGELNRKLAVLSNSSKRSKNKKSKPSAGASDSNGNNSISNNEDNDDDKDDSDVDDDEAGSQRKGAIEKCQSAGHYGTGH